MNIELIPLTGIKINGTLIPLGGSRAETSALLGQGEDIGDKCYYFDSELRIDLDKNGCVEFIEFLGGTNGKLHPTIYSIDVFSADPDEFLRVLSAQSKGDIIDSENGYSYSFPSIGVGIYRECTPADIDEMIKEMKADGLDPENSEELEYEKRRTYWQTIGIGKADYYK